MKQINFFLHANRSNVHLCTCCNMYGEIALISYGCLGIVHAWLVTDTISPALNTSITIGYRLHKIRPCPTFSLFSQPFILHPFYLKKNRPNIILFPPPFLSTLRKRDIQQIFLTATGDCNSARCKCNISSHVYKFYTLQIFYIL